LPNPELRTTLERKHGLADDEALQNAMLLEALDKKAFLKAWLLRTRAEITRDNVRELLKQASEP
jgi:hypothetical protein